VIYYGDPRVRSSYDVFGLALLAALLADRLGLDDTALDRRRNSDTDSPTQLQSYGRRED
jgi:hypothetical protein